MVAMLSPADTDWRQAGSAPPAEDLWRSYVVEDLPMAALTTRYRVGKVQVRTWLVDAGIPIRTKREAGRRRQLQPPAEADLRRLYVTQRLSAREIAASLDVSTVTVVRWLAEAGIERRRSPLKNRRRGERVPLARPTAATLRRLYVDERRSLVGIAAETGATVHLVRSWMDEYGIVRRPPGAAVGRRRSPMPRRYQPPEAEELARLRVEEHWSLPELAERYGVSAPTVSRWLADYRIAAPGRRGRRLPRVSVAELVHRYQDSQMTVTELAGQVGLSGDRVARELRGAGVRIDRTRRPAPTPRLGVEDRSCAVQRYLVDEWPMRRVAEALGCSQRSIRAELVAADVTIVRRSGSSRQDRSEAPPEQVERLYVAQQLTAEQTGGTLGFEGGIVLRTGHSYGLPIRPGGATPLVPADVRLIEDLYADEAVAAVLERHHIPRRGPTGGIAARFPVPVALTAELVRALYVDAGCSSTHVELLTGQPATTVVRSMGRWGIPIRQSRSIPPFLTRIRAARRQSWLDDIVERYQRTGSTRQIAWEQGCSQMTVERWLRRAGVVLPGRGQWPRGTQRWKPPETE